MSISNKVFRFLQTSNVTAPDSDIPLGSDPVVDVLNEAILADFIDQIFSIIVNG